MSWDRERAHMSLLVFVVSLWLGTSVVFLTINFNSFLAKIVGGIIVLGLIYFIGGSMGEVK